MALDEARTESDSAADHVTDHNTMHVGYNLLRDSVIDYGLRRPDGESAHADDQEFEGTIGGTAVTPTGTSTWTQGKGVLSHDCVSQTANDIAARAYALTPSSTPVTIETKIASMRHGAAAQNLITGLFFADGTTATDNVTSLMSYVNAAGVSNLESWSGTYTNLATAVGGFHSSLPESYLGGSIITRVIWSGANSFQATASFDGVTWFEVIAGAWSATLTPTHFGVFGSSWGGVALNHVTYEYIRVYETDLSL